MDQQLSAPIVNPLAGLVLDVKGGIPDQQSELHMWSKNGSQSQEW